MGDAGPVRAGQAIGPEPTRFVRDESAGRAVEARDIDEQAQERGTGQVPALCEKGVEVGAAVLEPGLRVGDAEAHLGRLRRDVEALEQRDETRVVRLVVNDEARVDPVRDTVDLDVDGVRVPADAAVGLEDRHVVVAVQLVRGDEPGDAGADDGDLHGVTPAAIAAAASAPARSTHQFQRRSASSSEVRVHGKMFVGRRRRSSQKSPLDARGSSAPTSQTIVSAPCAAVRSTGRARRANRGNDACRPGVSAQPGCSAWKPIPRPARCRDQRSFITTWARFASA